MNQIIINEENVSAVRCVLTTVRIPVSALKTAKRISLNPPASSADTAMRFVPKERSACRITPARMSRSSP